MQPMSRVARRHRAVEEFKVEGLHERESEEGTVWKRVFKGDAVVAGGRGWAETARTYIARSGLRAETDKACYD